MGAFSFSMAVLWIAKIALMLSLLVSVKLAVVSAVVYAVVVLAVLIWMRLTRQADRFGGRTL